MKHLVSRTAFAVAFVVCAFILLVPANIELRWLLLKTGARSPDDVTDRDPFYRWMSKWTTRVFRAFTAIMRVKVTMDLPIHGIERPSLILANHRSGFDVFTFPAVIARMGAHRMRGIVKRETGGMIVAGPAVRATGCALLSRGKDDRDIARIERCAQEARRDGACIAIFPEGALYGAESSDAARNGHRYVNVLPPRYGGVRALRAELPEYPVFSVTIDWNGMPSGTTLLDLHVMYGGHLHITAHRIDISTGEPVESWLEREWRRKDDALSHGDASM